MKNSFGSKVDNETRNRILEVAEKLFAEKGFRGVSVREITSSAKVHLSAINYHFGFKESLYLEVFRRRFLKRARLVRKNFKSHLKKLLVHQKT